MGYFATGSKSCGIYVKEYEEKDINAAVNLMWLKGYISGHNYSDNKNLGSNLDSESMSLWVYIYCKENPLEHTPVAAAALITELEKRSQ